MLPPGWEAASKREANWPGRNMGIPCRGLGGPNRVSGTDEEIVHAISPLYIYARQNSARILRSIDVSGSHVVMSVIHA